MIRRFEGFEEWVSTHCPGCRVDVDIPRSEWIASNYKPTCESCGCTLIEERNDDVYDEYDHEEELERRADRWQNFLAEYE